MTLIKDRVRSLEKANEALSKRRRAKRTYIQTGGLLTIEEAQRLIARKANSKGNTGGGLVEGEGGEASQPGIRCCKGCGKAGHNISTCQEVEEATSEEDCIICD